MTDWDARGHRYKVESVTQIATTERGYINPRQVSEAREGVEKRIQSELKEKTRHPSPRRD